MIEYVLVAGSIVAFISHYIYVLGKLSAKMQNCEQNVTWIRNFLLSKCTDSTHFSQNSDIKINDELSNLIPVSWCDTLDGANIDIRKCKNPYDCVVKISENQGMIRLKKRAERLDIPFNDFLLSSGIHLFNKGKKQKLKHVN